MGPVCIHCNKPFTPSIYHPDQKVCGREECRRKHWREYHRKKRATDPDYRDLSGYRCQAPANPKQIRET